MRNPIQYLTEEVRVSRLILGVALLGFFGYTATLSGCSLFDGKPPAVRVDEKPDVNDEARDLATTGEGVGEVGDGLLERADRIESGTDQVRDTLDASGTDSDIVDEPLDAIDTEARGLRADSAKLEAAELRIADLSSSLLAEQERIENLAGTLGDAEGTIRSLEEENRELRDKTNQLFKEKMAWIGVISVFGIGVSVVLIFFTRSGAATMVALGFAATLGISIAVSLYMQYIAWVTIAIVGIVAVGVIGYMAYRKFTENKSVDELVRTNEVAKDYLSQEARDHIFGRGAEPGVADNIQSKQTKQLVKQVRQAKKRPFGLAPSGSVQPKKPVQPVSSQPFVIETEESVTY